MIPWLTTIRTALDALQPGLFNALLALLLFGAMYLVKRFKPELFNKLPTALQAWPAMAIGAVIAALSASTNGNFLQAVVNAAGMSLSGLLSGVLAVGAHRTLKESPLPYATPPAKHDLVQHITILFLMLVVPVAALVACTKQQGREAVAAADVACTLLRSTDPTVGEVCAVESELSPLIRHLLAARRMAKARKAMAGASAVPVDPCSVPIDPLAARTP
jgi:hypothetical protein